MRAPADERRYQVHSSQATDDCSVMSGNNVATSAKPASTNSKPNRSFHTICHAQRHTARQMPEFKFKTIGRLTSKKRTIETEETRSKQDGQTSRLRTIIAVFSFKFAGSFLKKCPGRHLWMHRVDELPMHKLVMHLLLANRHGGRRGLSELICTVQAAYPVHDGTTA